MNKDKGTVDAPRLVEGVRVKCKNCHLSSQKISFRFAPSLHFLLQ